MAPAGPVQYAALCSRRCFSFLSAASQPPELVRTAVGLGHQALPIADLRSLAGVGPPHPQPPGHGPPLPTGHAPPRADPPRPGAAG
ncbi:hypothetical protein, partial [Thiohalocapsa sp.]|uniref:hypothetical protein n=1 Tax=Thiohalocapsa sp. TaxID=2497641 RepID=UPI0025FD3CF3